MKIGDEVYVHGYVDEIRKNCIIIRNGYGYFGTSEDEIRIEVDRKDEPQRFTDKDGDVWEWRDNTWKCISNDEPQADYTEKCHKCKRIRECGYPIVGKCKYEPQTERSE